MNCPISFDDIKAARVRIAPFLDRTPFRRYPELDEAVGSSAGVWLKHENHLPTNAFKVRNALSAICALSETERKRGVIAATRGNHGLGVAFAGKRLGIPVTICVPVGNNPEKNAGIRSLGAKLIEQGKDYDEAILVMKDLAATHGLQEIHSTNNLSVLAGAATLSLEMLEEVPDLDAIVVAVGGGSQAVGAIAVARELRPSLKVYGVQAEGAAASHDSWHRGERIQVEKADTFADGLATRTTYDLTFDALKVGLHDFVTVSDEEIRIALRLLLRTTHNLAEGAGAAGLAGLLKLRGKLASQKTGIILSGSNVDFQTLRQVLDV